jgi:hypothetical protein
LLYSGSDWRSRMRLAGGRFIGPDRMAGLHGPCRRTPKPPGRVPCFKHPVRSLSAVAAVRQRCCSEGIVRRQRHRCRRAVPAVADRDALRRPSRRHRTISRCVPAWRARLAQERVRLPSLHPGSSSWWSRVDRDCHPSKNIGWAGHRRTRLQSCRSRECSGAHVGRCECDRSSHLALPCCNLTSCREIRRTLTHLDQAKLNQLRQVILVDH